MYAQFEPNKNTIRTVRFAYGGMAPTSVLANKTAAKLKGLAWNEDIIQICNNTLIEDLPLEPGAPGGMEQYRRSLTLRFLFNPFQQ